MSELYEKLKNLRYLPVFPLPLIVLPNEFLPLHIFEPRYRQMLKDIELSDNLFGILFAESESGNFGKNVEDEINCIVEVRNVQPLEDGRYNIMTVGIIRYRLEEITQSDTPYHYGKISVFEDYEEDSEILQPIADEVFEMFTRAAKAAHKMSGLQTMLPEIPQAEPQTLSFLIAAALNLPIETKRDFIRTRSTAERLEKLRTLLKKSVEQIEESARITKLSKTNGHAGKKIEFE